MGAVRRSFAAALAAAFLQAGSAAGAGRYADPFRPATAPTNEVAVAVAVLPGNNMPVVEAVLDGAPCALLLDTGASHTTFDESFVRKNLPDAKLENVMLAGASNVEKLPKCFAVRTLSAGGATFGGFTAMALDIGHLDKAVGRKIDGILGLNVISRAPALLSLSSGKIVFNPPDAKGFGRPQRTIPPDGRLVVAAKHNGSRLEFLIDSGASFTFVRRGLWPEAGGKVALSVSDVNSPSSAETLAGEPGVLDLGAPVAVSPLIGDTEYNLIGADTLLGCDLLVFGRHVAFRPTSPPVLQFSQETTKGKKE